MSLADSSLAAPEVQEAYYKFLLSLIAAGAQSYPTACHRWRRQQQQRRRQCKQHSLLEASAAAAAAAGAAGLLYTRDLQSRLESIVRTCTHPRPSPAGIPLCNLAPTHSTRCPQPHASPPCLQVRTAGAASGRELPPLRVQGVWCLEEGELVLSA